VNVPGLSHSYLIHVLNDSELVVLGTCEQWSPFAELANML
jgi:hypothetical protein